MIFRLISFRLKNKITKNLRNFLLIYSFHSLFYISLHKKQYKVDDLIKRISELYMKYGIRSVTMDDLARELAISKKTLYQHFKDKEEVVEKVMDYHDQQQHCYIEAFFGPGNDAYNAIDQLIELSRFLSKHMSDVNHSVTYDLQKYYPAIWEKTTQGKRDYIFRNLVKNMEAGIQQGLYCSDLNIEIIAKAYVQRMELSANDNFLFDGAYSYQEVFKTLFIYHIRGIANEKGREYLQSQISKYEFADKSTFG